jgi:ribonuclease HII
MASPFTALRRLVKNKKPTRKNNPSEVYQCGLDCERGLWERGIRPVAGVDEAGRGPLAGPVVAAAAILPEDFSHAALNDSKQLTEPRREALFDELRASPGICFAIASVEADQVDALNILKATHLAMRLAAETLAQAPAHLLVDGLAVQGLPVDHTPLVKGDCRSLSIAAASILAKVSRDRFMREAHEKYPQYGFDKHKGYGTRQHLQALNQYGPCPLHRQSFAPVAQLQLAI